MREYSIYNWGYNPFTKRDVPQVYKPFSDQFGTLSNFSVGFCVQSLVETIDQTIH